MEICGKFIVELKLRQFTHYFCIFVISDWRIAFISAVLWAWNIGARLLVDRIVMSRWMKRFPGSDGPTIDTTSGSVVSSVANVRLNCSNKDFRGSTFVGDKHASSGTDFGSFEKLSDCFFFVALDGVLLDVRKIVFRLSPEAWAESFGGLVFCGSELGASGSVFWAVPSLPLLSFRHESAPRSKRRIGFFMRNCAAKLSRQKEIETGLKVLCLRVKKNYVTAWDGEGRKKNLPQFLHWKGVN